MWKVLKKLKKFYSLYMRFSVQVLSLLYPCHNICWALWSHAFPVVLIFLYYTAPLSAQKPQSFCDTRSEINSAEAIPLFREGCMSLQKGLWPLPANCVDKTWSRNTARIQVLIMTFQNNVTHHYTHHRGTDNYARYFTEFIFSSGIVCMWDSVRDRNDNPTAARGQQRVVIISMLESPRSKKPKATAMGRDES